MTVHSPEPPPVRVEGAVREGVLAQLPPAGQAVPVVFDSPHSGSDYPADFRHAVDRHTLRSAEDMYVDELFAAAPANGAALLTALFPRSYIDPNRRELDLDPALLDGEWPEPLQPGGKSRAGKGLIRSHAQGEPIYDRRLGVDEVQERLAGYYQPYHEALGELIATTRELHGCVWHVNCHSWTPPTTGRTGQPVNHVDFSLGNRDHTTSDPAFVEFVAGRLRRWGYEVRINRPFRGMECVKRYSDPEAGRHSLQIEINRNLYMDKRSYGKVEGFTVLQGHLTELIADICQWAHEQR